MHATLLHCLWLDHEVSKMGFILLNMGQGTICVERTLCTRQCFNGLDFATISNPLASLVMKCAEADGYATVFETRLCHLIIIIIIHDFTMSTDR